MRYRLSQSLTYLSALVNGAFQKEHRAFITYSGAVQLLPLLTAPIIARLYSPAEFGAYAIFFALSTIIGSSASLALHNAILLEKNQPEAARATLLAFVITFIVGILFTLTLVLVPVEWLISAFGVGPTQILIWTPLTVVLSSCYTTMYTWFIRQRSYDLLARNKVILAVSTALIQIGVGLLYLGPIGFVIANLLGYSLATVLLLGCFYSDMNMAKPEFNLKSATVLLRKHKDLPLFTMPAGLINTVSSQIPEFMINKFYGSHLLGQYSLANRMVSMPLGFIATSIQDIFRQKASAEYHENSNCQDSFRNFLPLLIFISVILILTITLFVPLVFPIIFGSEWAESGYLIRAIVFLLAVRFISSPLSYIWIVKGRQKMDMLWQVGLLVISAASFFVAEIIFGINSLEIALFLYSGAVGLWYVFCIFISYRYSR